MKKLTGLNSNISSFENKKLKNLQSTIGGIGTQVTQISNCPSCPGGLESDIYTDEGRYRGRIEMGC